jgi:hypothetical protein
MQIQSFKYLGSFVAALLLALPLAGQTATHCSSIGGTMSTNLAVVDQATTMGTVTGDLKGAVAATILATTQNPDGTVSFVVQHHLVTESGDTLFFAQATAVSMPLSATRFAVLSYPVTIQGGTGKYANAKGKLDSIGEVDLSLGQTVFRYTGKLCVQGGD